MNPFFRTLPLWLLLGSCETTPGFEDPEITISPRYYALELRGPARMQSVSGGQIRNNSTQGMREFGNEKRDDDVGVTLAIGDGFSGLEFSYINMSINDSKLGTLTADFGLLPAGTEVQSAFQMDEYRVTYIAEVLGTEFDFRDEPFRMRAGLGGAFVHRNGDFSMWEDSNPDLNQDIKFSDNGLPFLSARGRLDYRDFGLQVDWSYNPDINFGKEFEGEMHDVEILGSYRLDAQDITFLVGHRWSEIPASGTEKDLRWDTGFEVSGYVIGVAFKF